MFHTNYTWVNENCNTVSFVVACMQLFILNLILILLMGSSYPLKCGIIITISLFNVNSLKAVVCCCWPWTTKKITLQMFLQFFLPVWLKLLSIYLTVINIIIKFQKINIYTVYLIKKKICIFYFNLCQQNRKIIQ